MRGALTPSGLQVTILFSDIAGFTSIAERTEPNTLLYMLSDYFTAMATIIEDLGGTLLEFIGDAILAIWNAPAKCPTHAINGVEASVRMQEQLNALVPTWRRKGYPTFTIRVGIHTDTVWVGNLGAPDRMKYGIMGDGVNFASRLEELNKRYANTAGKSGRWH